MIYPSLGELVKPDDRSAVASVMVSSFFHEVKIVLTFVIDISVLVAVISPVGQRSGSD